MKEPQPPLGCSKMCRVQNWLLIALIAFGWTMVGVVAVQHFASPKASMTPVTVLNGVVVDVLDGEVVATQIVRGDAKWGATLSFSNERLDWEHSLPLSCDDVGVKLLYVRPAFRSWGYETVIIVQDNTDMCEETYGP